MIEAIAIIFIGLICVAFILSAIAPILDVVKNRDLYRTEWEYVQSIIGSSITAVAVVMLTVLILIYATRTI